MVAQSATHSRTGHAVMTREVTDYAANDGALDTTMGAGGDRERRSTQP
jgi:hypothetical protein